MNKGRMALDKRLLYRLLLLYSSFVREKDVENLRDVVGTVRSLRRGGFKRNQHIKVGKGIVQLHLYLEKRYEQFEDLRDHGTLDDAFPLFEERLAFIKSTTRNIMKRRNGLEVLAKRWVQVHRFKGQRVGVQKFPDDLMCQVATDEEYDELYEKVSDALIELEIELESVVELESSLSQSRK